MRRRIGFEPSIVYFKPAGVPIARLKEVVLAFEELEAVRLKDLLQMEQREAAERMNISQPTFHRLLLEARKKVADAIVNGKAIRIEGGIYKMVQPTRRGMARGRGGAGGKGMGFGGPPLECVCPKCGTQSPKARGRPCIQQKCPKCGTPMTRSQ